MKGQALATGVPVFPSTAFLMACGSSTNLVTGKIRASTSKYRANFRQATWVMELIICSDMRDRGLALAGGSSIVASGRDTRA